MLDHSSNQTSGPLLRYRVLIEQDEDGMFVAECPTLPGCVSQGQTRNEANKNIKDAVAGYIESLRKHNEPILPSIWEETIIRQAGLTVDGFTSLL